MQEQPIYSEVNKIPPFFPNYTLIIQKYESLIFHYYLRFLATNSTLGIDSTGVTSCRAA